MLHIIGHRGAKGYIAENTLPSFEKAISLKADAIELDVHLCKTGELIVFHDDNTKALTGHDADVSDLELHEIKNLRVDTHFTIPTLSEVIEGFGNKCKINIELKGKNTAIPVGKLVEHYTNNGSIPKENILISSFLFDELKLFSTHYPAYKLGVLTKTDFQNALQEAKTLNAFSLHPHFSLLTQENVTLATENNLKLFVWTVNEVDDINFVKQFKLEGIISDFPDRI